MKGSWWLSQCLYLLLGLTGVAYAEETVVIDVDAENPPFMYSKAGKAEGIYPALMREAFKRMNVPVTIDAKPWKRVIDEIDKGQVGVAGIYKSEERLKKYDYSDTIMVENIAVYYNDSAPVMFTGMDSLNGKSVGVIRGWIYSDDFSAAQKAGKFKAEEVGGDEKNFEKLQAKHLDSALAIEQSGNALLATGKYPNIKMNSKYVSSSESFLAFNKSSNKTALIEQFNQALAAMKADGSFDKIVTAAASQ